MLSFVVLSMLLGLGHLLRVKVRLFHKLYLPSSVIGGLVGLAVLQFFDVPADWTAGWGAIPGKLINIVFACLFLGVTIPKFNALWGRAWKQLAYGQIVAWGQYVVGIGVFVGLLRWFWPKLPDVFGCVLPVGFEGGHGTAGGLAPVFAHFNWEAGKDFALTSATAGIMSAIVVGMALVNWAVRRGYVEQLVRPDNEPEDDTIGVIPVDRRPSAGKLTVSSDIIESFSLHLVVVAGAILIGYVGKAGLVEIQEWIPYCKEHNLLGGFPLFPLCMLGGMLIQLGVDKFDRAKMIDVGLIRRIQNCALDYLVVAAIATIRIDVIAAGLVPLLLLVIAGLVWNVCCVMFLAPAVFGKSAWFERAIAEMGQSMGVTATGLLLLRVVDPDYETDAADAFATKQLLHEPFMGGGLWTGMAIPLCFAVGAIPVLGIAVGAVVVWAVILIVSAKRNG